MSSKFISELKEGMLTLNDTYSTSGKLILPKDTVITKSIISKLRSNDVIFVDINDEVEETSPIWDNFTIDEENIKSKPEYKKFSRRYAKNVEDVTEHLSDIVHKNASLDTDAMLKSTLNIIKSTDSPLSIFTMLSTMKDYDNSTFNHCINVSLICNIFAKWLGLSDEEVELVTTCGLFHDIGKLLIPEHILQKPGKLTDEEYAIIKTHSKIGYDLLKKKKADIHVQYAALMHHEKCDGSGYPLGLIDNQIDWCSQIVTIADIYEAMTATRAYRSALSPFTVINNFEQNGLKKYNPRYLLTFLEYVVNSYLNCKVKLSNGEEGDVVYINKVSLSKPLIKTKDNYIDLSKNYDISIDSIL